MQMEKMELFLIKPYHRNPRTNNQTIETLKKSIIEYGFNSALLVDKDNIIITGHTRYKAVSQLKGKLGKRIAELKAQGKHELAENLQAINDGFIFVVHNNDLTEEQVRKFRIADNKIGELSKWDKDLLKAELRELDSVLGFTEEDVQKLLDDTKALTEVTEEAIEKVEEEMETHMVDLSKQEDLVDLTCPYCGETYSVRIKEIKKDKEWGVINQDLEATG